MAACPHPAPDRVEHDDHGSDHDDGREACVYETLNRSFRLLRERPEDVRDRFEARDERRRTYKRERQDRHPGILRASGIDDDSRRDAQSDSGEQLVRDAKHRPDRRNRA